MVWPNAEAQSWLLWVASAMEAASSRWSEARLWAVQQVWQLQQELMVPWVLAPALSRAPLSWCSGLLFFLGLQAQSPGRLASLVAVLVYIRA